MVTVLTFDTLALTRGYKMTRDLAFKQDSDFHVEYADEYGGWCVFGDESGFAYSAWTLEREARCEAGRLRLIKQDDWPEEQDCSDLP